MVKTLYLTFDFEEWHWPWHVTPHNVRLHEIYVYTKYQMSISIGSKVMANVEVGDLTYIFYLWPWRMTLTLTCYPLKCSSLWDICVHQMSISIGLKVMANVKVGNLTYIFYLWPWRMTLTLTYYPSKCAASSDTYVCQVSSLYPFWLKNMANVKVAMAKTKNLTFDLEEWPWPWHVTPQNVCLYEMCTQNIKCLCLLDQMLWPMLKWRICPIFFTFDLEEWPWP